MPDEPDLDDAMPDPLTDLARDELLAREVGRIDRNFVRLGQKLQEAEARIEKKRRPLIERRPRKHRVGRAARFDPDDARATPWLVAGMLTFVVAALIAAFAGQIAMAPYTTLPPELFWLVPVFVDLPIILLAYIAQVFRRRKQRSWDTWLALVLFTAGSSVIQIVHVLSVSGVLDGATMTVEIWVGVSIMGSVPWIVLFSWEQLTKLLVKPQGEKREPAPPAPARKRTTPRRSPAK